MSSPSVRLVPLRAQALDALLGGDLHAASELAGVSLPPFFVAEDWPWRLRAEQIHRDPTAADWIVRAAVTEDKVVVGRAQGSTDLRRAR